MNRFKKDKEWLIHQYCDLNLSLAKVGELSGVSAVSIQYWMRKYNIPTKKSTSPYFKGKTIEEMGHKLLTCNCSFCKLKRGDKSWLTDEIRIKRNKSIEHSLNSEQGIQNLRNSQLKRYENPIERKKTAESTKEQWKNPEIRNNRIKGLKEAGSTVDFKRKSSVNSLERWKDPIYKKRVIRKTLSTSGKNKSMPEKYLDIMLSKLYENEWIHNNKNDETFKMIVHKVPDFYHKTLPIVIEVNGNYWHGKQKTGIDNEIHEQQQIEYYKKHGYDCLVFWESEIKGMNFEPLLIERISQLYFKFNNNCNTLEKDVKQYGV